MSYEIKKKVTDGRNKALIGVGFGKRGAIFTQNLSS